MTSEPTQAEGHAATQALEPAKMIAFEKRMAQFEQMLRLSLPIIRRLVPKHVDPETVFAIAMSARSRNPALMDCTDGSVLRCAVLSAQFGLDVSGVGGKAYMIPYFNKDIRANEAQFQFGYRGLIELAMRSGKLGAIYGRAVYEGEPFEYEDGMVQRLRHQPLAAPDKQVIAAWAVAVHTNAFRQAEVLWRHQIESRRAVSRAADGPAWKHWYAEMSLKSVIRVICKKLPDSVELARALDIEDRADLGLPPADDLEVQAALAPAVAAAGIVEPVAPTPATQTERVKSKVKRGRSEAEKMEPAEFGAEAEQPDIPGMAPGEEEEREPGGEG